LCENIPFRMSCPKSLCCQNTLFNGSLQAKLGHQNYLIAFFNTLSNLFDYFVNSLETLMGYVNKLNGLRCKIQIEVLILYGSYTTKINYKIPVHTFCRWTNLGLLLALPIKLWTFKSHIYIQHYKKETTKSIKEKSECVKG